MDAQVVMFSTRGVGGVFSAIFLFASERLLLTNGAGPLPIVLATMNIQSAPQVILLH